MELSGSENINASEVNFVPEIFRDKMKGDTNPGRGWYQVYTFKAEDTVDENELIWSLDKSERLALVLLDISCCRERTLNRAELENTERILRFFSIHGKEMIIRPLYDREGKGLEKEPEEFSLVFEHIKQVGELIKKYSGNIHAVQGLFVGSWGEMHGSKFLSDENMKKLAGALFRATEGKCFLSVRTPVQKRIIADSGIESGRIALFNDGLFGSETHLGTFGRDESADSLYTAWTAVKETDYIENACRFTPNGGEAVDGGGFTDEEIIDTLRRMHISYLNRIYDAKIIDRWKNTYLPGHGASMYDYIGMRLGYRFIVEKAWVCGKEDITVSVIPRNEGFACLYRKAEVYLKVTNECSGELDIPCTADLRKLASGEKMVLTFSIKGIFRKNCNSDISLFIRHENGEYIRTANAPESDFTPVGKIKGIDLD